jgi:D-alanyl-lipoteichoic acid acyltransferase DltB (MBOAT superfamily)
MLRNFADISALDAHSLGWRWTLLVVHPWYFYLNFAGYSDWAIGAAALYGFSLKPNFHFPFFQTSVQSFWANWHMSLTRWAQRNVFLPLGGYRVRRQYFAVMMTMLAISFWHDISLSLLLFGFYHSSALILERIAQQRKLFVPWHGTRIGKVIQITSTYLFVAFSFPALELPWSRLAHVYASLFGVN